MHLVFTASEFPKLDVSATGSALPSDGTEADPALTGRVRDLLVSRQEMLDAVRGLFLVEALLNRDRYRRLDSFLQKHGQAARVAPDSVCGFLHG